MPTDPRVMNGLHELAATAHTLFVEPTATARQAHDFALSVIGYCERCDEQKRRTGDAMIRPVEVRDVDAERRRELTEAAASLGATVTFADEAIPPLDSSQAAEDVAVAEGLDDIVPAEEFIDPDTPVIKGAKAKRDE